LKAALARRTPKRPPGRVPCARSAVECGTEFRLVRLDPSPEKPPPMKLDAKTLLEVTLLAMTLLVVTMLAVTLLALTLTPRRLLAVTLRAEMPRAPAAASSQICKAGMPLAPTKDKVLS